MGSHGRLFLADAPDELEPRLRVRLDELEQRWSRFIEDSEVNAMNAAAGSPFRVSEDTLLLIERALTASRRTRGWFDPTLLRELEALGYDQTYVQLTTTDLGPLVVTTDHRGAGQATVHEWGAACRWITMDRNASTVTIPEGAGFDPGGLGKGLAADLVLAEALSAGAGAALIELGGDIVTGGRAPADGWLISIEDPFVEHGALGSVRIPWGAVATSSKSKRRWRNADGHEHHHLLDPRSGTPSTSSVMAATVIAGTCWQAEASAKAAVLAGVTNGIELLDAAGLEGVLVDADGKCHLTLHMDAYFEPARLAA